jgi:DNA-binding CsgD family transcriptional regulator
MTIATFDLGREERLRQRVLELEAQVELLTAIVRDSIRNGGGGREDYGFSVLMRGMTMKQAAVLQMLMRGWTNSRMSGVMECSMSTTKTHLKSLIRKFGAGGRAELVAMLAKGYGEIGEGVFLESTGVPKNWCETPENWPEITRKIREATR